MSCLPATVQRVGQAQPAVRAEMVLLAAMVSAVVAFWPTVTALLELWGNPQRQTYQHGYLIAAISVWLVARDRHRIAACARAGNAALLLGAVGASLAWAVAVLGGIQTLHMVFWPIALWTALTFILGWRAGVMLALPVGYLYFAVPVWDVFTPFLQWATVAANAVLTQLAGIPAYIEGDEVHIPAGTFLIEGRCSGLNYFVASLAIGALYGEFHRDPLGRRILQFVLIGLLAMVTNWIRVFAVIVAGHLTDMQHYLVKVDHQDFGWALFGVVLLAFFLIVRRWPAVDPPSREASAGSASGASGPSIKVVVLGLAAMMTGPLLASLAHSRPIAETVTIKTPDWAGWIPREDSERVWHPVFPGADAELRRDVWHDGSWVRTYAAGFAYQDQSRELAGHGVSLLGDGQWAWSGPLRTVETSAGSARTHWSEREASRGEARTIIWWTYQVGTARVASAFAQQLRFGIVSLWKRPVAGVVVLSADCIPDCEAARQSLSALARSGVPRASIDGGDFGDRD